MRPLPLVLPLLPLSLLLPLPPLPPPPQPLLRACRTTLRCPTNGRYMRPALHP